MHFIQVFFLFASILSFNAEAKRKPSVNKVWSQKFAPYKKRREEYKKKEHERSKNERVMFSPIKKAYSEKLMELSNAEKDEIKKIKKELYKDIKIFTFTGSKKERQKEIKDLTSIKIKEGQKIQEIKNKYARLKIDEEKKYKVKTYKIMETAYQEWKSLYDKYQMDDYPMPNPEIEEVEKPKRKSIVKFNKSKIRIYKKGIIGRRDAIFTPLARKINIEKIKAKDEVRIKFKYKIQAAQERNQNESRKLALEFLKKHSEAEKKGNIEKNQTYQNEKTKYITELQKLSIQKSKIPQALKKEMSKEMILVEKPFRLKENEKRKEIEEKLLGTTPDYVQQGLRKN